MSQSLPDLQMSTREAAVSGPGATDPVVRRQVADGAPPPELTLLVQKIRNHAYKVTDEDLDALRARYPEDQLFELIVAAAIGASESRMKAALAALERA
jgi:hypothetical protein